MRQYIGAANHLEQCNGAADKKNLRNINNLKRQILQAV
jgi:hypothetical protein